MASQPTDHHTREFDLARYGTVTARITRAGTDAVVYALTGPEVSGAFTVRVEDALNTDGPHVFSAAYGIDTAGGPAHCRPRRLTIGDVALIGGAIVAREAVIGLTGDLAHGRELVTRASSLGGVEPAPTPVIRHTLALLTRVLADFAAREDLDALHRAATITATRALPSAERERRDLDAQITALTIERNRAIRVVQVLERIAGGHTLPSTPRQLLDEIPWP